MPIGFTAGFASFFPDHPAYNPLLPASIRRNRQNSWSMALVSLKSIDDLLLRRDFEELGSKLLSPAEQAVYCKFGHAKRQREWLGGRLACKSALLDLSAPPAPVSPCELSIASLDSGAPVLETVSAGSGQPVAISISHSNEYAVAIAARSSACGIDIQLVTDRTERVRERFAADTEVDLLRSATRNLDASQRLTLLWAAKESVKKALFTEKPGFLQNITLKSLACREKFHFSFGCPGYSAVKVTAALLDGYALAFTVKDDHA